MYMKRRIIMLCLAFLFVTACDKKEDISVDINYVDDYYQVYTPYKGSVANNYVMSNVINDLDIEQVELSLMDISKKYFKTNNSYYQEGQYLDEDSLETILNNDNLNKADNIIVDDISIDPLYISYIYEQNYLSSNGNLKGISLAIILNPYQEYKNSYGTRLYKEVELDTVVNFGKEKANELIKYIRSLEGLQNIKTVIGLYVLSSPNDILPGNFHYVSSTSNNDLNFMPVNYKNYYVDDNYVFTNDTKTYNGFKNLEKEINDVISKTRVIGQGLYVDYNLSKLNITVSNAYLNSSQILMLSKLISESIIKNFNNDTSIKVFIKTNDQLEAMILKKGYSHKADIYIVRG